MEEIELKSEEFQEVLSHVPSWVQRWGITLIFIVLAVLIAGSCFFKYPEILNAPLVVSTQNLPFDIVAKVSGRIDTLFVLEKQQVSKNQLLGVLENSAKTEDVLELDTQIEDSTTLRAFAPSTFRALSLGDLQPAYNQFIKSFQDYQFFLKTDYHSKKIKTIEKQKTIQQNILNHSVKQLSLSKKQLQTAQNQFRTDSNLFVKNVLSAFEFETAKNTYLQAQQSYENARTGIENQRLGILQLEQQIFDLQQQKNEQLAQLQLNFTANLDALKAQIETFKQTCFLISQIDGTCSFTKYYQKNQNVAAGETILTVVPNEKQKIIGKIYLPPARAGKVKIGQTVNVKLDDFPYQEYGMLKVKITNISLVPIVENGARSYVLEVELPENLQTTYHKTLTFKQQMSGQAEIITEDLRLIERFFNPIKAIFDK
ncbi:MAG: HlyD family secretion protein [Bacteroidales bacterium]|nr:HlyD family secretion protein [Bacteroidales bacterium]